MALGPRLELRQSQSLVMTPQLRQAIQLLQYSNLEADAFVAAELERNPLLERDDSSDAPAPERAAIDQTSPPAEPADAAAAVSSDSLLPAGAALDNDAAEPYDGGGPADGGRGGSFDSEDLSDDFAAAGPSLREYLAEQLRLTFHAPAERVIAASLLALLEPSGRIAVAPQALADTLGTSLAAVEAVRGRLMRLDPTGMFATSLAECLAVQLAERNRLDPAMQALLDNLDLLARRDMKRLMAVCGVDGADMTDMVAELRRLDPKPGANWDDAPPQTRIADVLLRPAPDGGWLLELNPQTMPRVLVRQGFAARLLASTKGEDRSFITQNLQSANWLVKSLQQRAQTILTVAAEVVRRQDAFFRHGVAHLRPLVLREVAEAVELHESTVSRVTNNKFIATPRGVVEMKYLFNTAIAATRGGETHSAEAIRHRIRGLIQAEAPDAVLSDDAIVLVLQKEGVDIARRTVAKYRESLGIPSSVQRKREKAEPV